MADDSVPRELTDPLHRRLLNGDLTASAEIAELLLPLVVRSLRGRHPNLHDPHLAETAADDAVLNYLRRPDQFDPSLLPLDRYLIMSARGDLLNLLRKDRSADPTEIVELDHPDREYGSDVRDESLGVEEQVPIQASPVWPLLAELLPNPVDREMALLILENVRETAEYARILGVDARVREEQEAEVKRHKDRIKKVLRRHIRPSDLGAR
jgi:hypothetical protein